MRLIDADDLKNKELEKFGCDPAYYYGHPKSAQSQYLLEALYHAPTVDAEPVRHGKWMEKRETSKFHVRYFECSECRAASYRYQTRMNYCPNCGAKMDKEG